jgi:hypothetical protein
MTFIQFFGRDSLFLNSALAEPLNLTDKKKDNGK